MEDQPGMPSEKAEKLLRQWGAEEAARRPAEGGADSPAVEPRRPVVYRIGRVAAVAAAVLLAMGACLLLGRRWERSAGEKRLAVAGAAARARIAAVEAELAKAGDDLATAERLRRDAEKAFFDRSAEHRQAARQLEARIAKLQKELKDLPQGLPPSQRERLQEQVAALNASLAAEAVKRVASEKQLMIVQGKLTAAMSDLTRTSEELSDVRKRLTSAATELSRVGQAHRRAIEAAKELNADLVATRARQQGMLATFQKLYLSAAAPGQSGWGARTSAARSGRLSAQAAALRAEARTAEGIKLLAKLEVILTRLELLDTDNVLEVQSFAALVASSGLAGDIDRVLAAGREPPQFRAWLLVARLLILGDERVG